MEEKNFSFDLPAFVLNATTSINASNDAVRSKASPLREVPESATRVETSTTLPTADAPCIEASSSSEVVIIEERKPSKADEVRSRLYSILDEDEEVGADRMSIRDEEFFCREDPEDSLGPREECDEESSSSVNDCGEGTFIW